MMDPAVKDSGALPVHDLLSGGKWTVGADGRIEVLDKYLLRPCAAVSAANVAQIQGMIDAADAAFQKGAPGAYGRGEILQRAAALLAERKDDFVEAMQAEAGFTASDAAGEVARCQETLRLSAEEARRLAGDMIPFDGAPGQSRRMAFTLRVPLGVVAAITPFNSPLNTVAHKIAPAFAAGNAVILKPSAHTPVTACKLAEVLVDAGMPEGFLSVLHCRTENIKHLLDDPRVRFFAFTGSTQVGRIIQQAAGLRRTQMELGSIAFTTLLDDADLDKALPKVAAAGFRKAGQVCTSVQMLLVHESIRETVEERLAKLVADLTYGDPRDSKTVVGPLITEDAAIRAEAWVEEAVAAGATRLVGGGREGAVMAPTLLTGIDSSMKVGCQEIFGPVVSVVPISSLDDAIRRVNATPYGLASGIFTSRITDALDAAHKLRVGGVHINETSSSRVDMMPFGGSKDSGFGREGPHYAVQEMTEERMVTVTY